MESTLVDGDVLELQPPWYGDLSLNGDLTVKGNLAKFQTTTLCLSTLLQ